MTVNTNVKTHISLSALICIMIFVKYFKAPHEIN